jgi:Flp pilus assembly protein TadG
MITMMHHRVRKIRNGRRWRRLCWLQRFRRDERGVQLVELAIVLPLMLMLFGAAAEFGRFFYEYSTLAKATRVGARYLTTSQVTAGDDAKAKNIIVYGNAAGTGSPVVQGLTTGHIVITREGGIPTLPKTVKVQIIGFKHQPIFDLGAMIKQPSLSLAVQVKPSVTMRYLITQPPNL